MMSLDLEKSKKKAMNLFLRVQEYVKCIWKEDGDIGSIDLLRAM